MDPLKIFSVNSKNKEFWFGHLVVLVATVMAVYLAASAGLKSAVEFELIKSDRDSYYMRAALLAEVQDNVQTFEQWGAEYRSGKANKFSGKSTDTFRLDDYVWVAMQDSDGTFEIPSDILTGIRRYYSATQATLAKMTSRGAAAKEVTQMLAESETFKAGTVSALEADVNALKAKLTQMDIDL